ncbi:MAG: nuclear transport factor 2 family protein [Solirubrobacterales bacterium]
MSEQNLEIARRAYAAYNAGGVEAILDFFDPEIEWRMWEEFAREPRVYQGHAGVREALSVFESEFDGFGAEPHEFIDAGDRIVVPVRLGGRAKGSGEETFFELVQVWTARGNRAVRLDVYASREEALRALGLDDGTSSSP